MNIDEIDNKIEKEKTFIRNRITELRLSTDISEYQMSLELGQNHGYVQSISSGKAMPSMSGFLNICDYFGITPMEFFDPDIDDPSTLNRVYNSLKNLSEDDLYLVEQLAKRLSKNK